MRVEGKFLRIPDLYIYYTYTYIHIWRGGGIKGVKWENKGIQGSWQGEGMNYDIL